MRYYDIVITNSKTGEIVRPKSLQRLNLPSTFTSYINGKSIAGALDIEINIPLYNYANPLQGAYVQIWGLGLEELSQATDLAGHDILIRAGMKAGLPLANPKQSGVIVQGRIFQSIGNWQGTEMSLSLLILASTGTGTTAPKNFSFNWRANTPLADAIKTTVNAALPGFAIQMAISDDLKLPADQPGVYSDLVTFSKAIADLTRAKPFRGIKTLDGRPYGGVQISIDGKTIKITDGTKSEGGSSPDKPKEIAFQDLIGQPTWYSASQVTFKTVMRADIAVKDYVKMPTKLTAPYVLTTQGASPPGAPSRNKAAFQGVFLVQGMQHFGRFRQPDASSWVTVYQAVFKTQNDLFKESTLGGGAAAP